MTTSERKKTAIAMHASEKFPTRKAFAGFTLLETLMAVVVVGILATVSSMSYTKYITRARVSAAISDIGKIKLKIDQYRLNHDGNPPLSLADISAQQMLDPWGTPYEFLNFSTVKGNGKKRKDHNLVPINTEFDLYSKGADRDSVGPLTAAKSRDDVIMANDGSFIGLASDY